MSKKWFFLALKFLVSGFLIWFLLSNIDFDDALSRMAKADLSLMALAWGLLVVQVFIGGFRWGAVLKVIGEPLSFLRVTQIFYFGVFFNQVLPSSVGGDAVRIYKTYRDGLSLRGAVNGVLLERVAAVLALVVLILAMLPQFLMKADPAAKMVLVPGVAFVSVGAVVGLLVLVMLDRLPEGLRRWRLVRGLGNLGVDARKVFLVPRSLLTVMFWGLATNVNISTYAYVLALSLGLEITWLDCLVLVPSVLLVMTIPISIAGWGIRETAMVTLFGLIGIAAEGSLALSVLFGLSGICVALPGGIFWLLSREKGETMDFETPEAPPQE
ncbi:MAG: flippase-like domain-containing protein [Rhodospirillales bacterium]|nr:flippase-like domain-containing protein [Rhodospirillales bacterium]